MASPAYRPWGLAKKRQNLRWQRAVNAYPCPECTAGPGDWCHTKNGNKKSEPHADRARLASANGWKDPEEADG